MVVDADVRVRPRPVAVHRVLDLVLNVVHGLFELVVLVEVHGSEGD